MIYLRRVLAACLILLTSCASESCRKYNNRMAMEEGIKKMESEFIWVYKYDESLQCEEDKTRVSVETMKERDLGEDVEVLASQSMHDGLLRAQMCGQATGVANLYKIPLTQLEEARKRGFEPWTFTKIEPQE